MEFNKSKNAHEQFRHTISRGLHIVLIEVEIKWKTTKRV